MSHSNICATKSRTGSLGALRFCITLIVIALLASWNLPAKGLAAAGELDPTFGNSGKVTTDFGASASAAAVAVQSDGKLVAAGLAGGVGTGDNFALARYNTDGSLDRDFDFDGMATIDFFGDQDVARAVAISPDGKILAAGFASGGMNFDFALVRLNPNGSLDSAFGVGGRVTTDFFGSSDRAFAMALQPDGKIVLAGNTMMGGATEADFALARYNNDGSLDLSFGSGGRVTTDFFGEKDEAYAVAIKPDGRILAAGKAEMQGGGRMEDFALARYNSDGSLDRSFGSNGKVTTDFFGAEDEARGITGMADGRLLLAGYSRPGSSSSNANFALARYDADGALDSSFGSNGRVTADFFGREDGACGAAIRNDGK